MKKYNDHFQAGKLYAWIDMCTFCNAGCPQCHRTEAQWGLWPENGTLGIEKVVM